MFRVVLSPGWEYGMESAIDVTLLSRYFERYADHAVSIMRRMVHMITGEPYANTESED
jgi:phosphate transport system protein